MSGTERQIDRIDRRILRQLQGDGRITIVELARRVGISKTPCLERMRRLEAAGYIEGYGARLNPDRLGADHVAFVQVTLGSTTSEALEAFNEAARQVPQIQGCYMIAGDFDYLLKVRSADIRDYRRLLGEEIAALPHVVQTSTFVVMETVKDTVSVPVAEG